MVMYKDFINIHFLWESRWTFNPVGVLDVSPHTVHTCSLWAGKVVESLLLATGILGLPLQNFLWLDRAWIVLYVLLHLGHWKNSVVKPVATKQDITNLMIWILFNWDWVERHRQSPPWQSHSVCSSRDSYRVCRSSESYWVCSCRESYWSCSSSMRFRGRVEWSQPAMLHMWRNAFLLEELATEDAWILEKNN